MRSLSEKQARNCEEALGDRCRCRCGGALHGIKRGGDNPPRSWYESLPEDDPHHVKPKKPAKPGLTITPEVGKSIIFVVASESREAVETNIRALGAAAEQVGATATVCWLQQHSGANPYFQARVTVKAARHV